MDTYKENEERQLQRLEELQRTCKSILSSHVVLLVTIGLLVAAAFLTMFYLRARNSTSRFTAQVALHYQPKSTQNVQPYNDKYVMHILAREAVRHQFIESLNASLDTDNNTGPKNIQIEQTFRQTNYFVVSLSAATEKDAVAFVNMFAELCILAYTDERMAYLESWKNVLEQNRNEFAAKIKENNDKMAQVEMKAVVLAPEKNYEFLQNRLTSERANLAKQEAALRAMEQQYKALEDSRGDILPGLLPNIGRIHKYQAELAGLEQELRKLRELYTDRNPKVKAVETRRLETEKEFHAFLEQNGLGVADMAFLESAPAVIKELDRVSEELESMRSVYEVQKELVASLNNDLESFVVNYPKRQELIRQQEKYASSMEKLDKTIMDINYLMPLVKNDLFIGERAQDAKEKLPFTKETISVTLLASVAITGIFALMLLVSGYFYGKVVSEEELDGLSGLRYLGIHPTANSKFEEGSSERLFFSGISHQFNMVKPLPKTLLMGSLPGGELSPEFVQAFAEDCSMGDRKVLVLNLVQAEGFKIPVERDLHRAAIAVYSNSKGYGYLPVSNLHSLESEEERKLRHDLLLLQKVFDLVCIVQNVPLSQDGMFLRQVSMMCDGAILAVGAKKTPRRLVRQLQENQSKVGLLVMTILSGRITSC